MLAAIASGFESFSKQLCVSPTGSGKTNVFCWMIEAELQRGGRALVLVDQDELVWQPAKRLKQLCDIVADIEKAEHHAKTDSKVVIASIQSMVRRLDKWNPESFSLVIADEADKSIANTWQSCLKHFDGAANVCGFTATAFRSDKRSLGEYYENIAYEISLQELIRQGYLSSIVIKQLPIVIDLSGVASRAGDYDANDLNDAITPHLMEAACAIRDHAMFRKVLVFVPLIATSQKFVAICNSIGLAAEHIDGTSEDRSEKLTRFQNGEFDVLVNSQLLLRGVDIPAVDCCVMLRPTKSVALYQQAIGRGTRLSPGKSDLLILDFLFDAQKKMVCRPAHLIAKTQEEADDISAAITEENAKPMPASVGEQLTAFDLLGMQSIVQAQREKALRKKIEEHKDKKAKTISAEEFCVTHNRSDLAEFEPTMKWESEPVTEKQAKYLKQAGIDLASVSGKGHATKLLNIHFSEKKLVLASPKAIAMMRNMPHICKAAGIESLDNVTQGQQRKFFAALNNNKKQMDQQ